MKRALVSVSNKIGLIPFVQGLVVAGYEIISTGGTKKYLEQVGIPVIAVSEITNSPEILDGRVKTLHPAIHGGLLAQRNNISHQETLKKEHILPIDLVCVNLYPFKETLQKENVAHKDIIEQIDIGGPSMLRSAAKNYQDVTVVSNPDDYPLILEEMKNFGTTTFATREKLAAKVFGLTASYDALIAQYMNQQAQINSPEKLTLTYDLKEVLRYGENSHQKAWLYEEPLMNSLSLVQAQQLNGKQLSYNNLKDAQAALEIIREFKETTVVAVKHLNPCGIGQGKELETAWNRAYAADPVSIFGGVIILNRKVDVNTALKMSKLFLEIIIAPDYEKEAYDILSKKKNLRILKLPNLAAEKCEEYENISIDGGLLRQEVDSLQEDITNWTVVTDVKPTQDQLAGLMFAWKAVKHVKSNAIVVANKTQTLGIGAGQPNRIDSVKIAIEHAGTSIDQNTILASDAFFPMADSVEYAAKHGIKIIVQPGGSIRDQDSIDMANKYGIAMVFTGVRHFKH